MGVDDVDARPDPRGVRIYVATLAALAGAAVAATAVGFGNTLSVPRVSIVGFFALLAVAEYLIVRFNYRGEVIALTLFEAVLAPALFVLPPLVFVGVVALAQILAGAGHRLPPIKTIFNASQWTVAGAAGAVIFRALGNRPSLSASRGIGLVAAMAAIGIINACAVTLVMRIAEGRRLSAIVIDLVPAMTLGWIVNIGFGGLFLISVQRTQAAIMLCIVPLVTLHVASRGLAASVADRRRLGAMNRTLLSLAAPSDPKEAIPRFLEEVRDGFGARAVDLVLCREDGTVVHHSNEGYERAEASPDSLAALLARTGAARTITDRDDDAEIAAACAREGWRQCLAAPLFVDGRMLGTLCVYDSTGLEGVTENELAVLQALAAEAAGMIRRGVLLETVLEERRKLSDIVDSTSDGIVTIRSDGVIDTWNPAMEVLTGYSADELVGTRLLGVLRPRDAADAEIFLDRWAEGQIPPHDLQISDRNGNVRWLSCSYASVTAPDGAPQAIIIVARDVTRVREFERVKDDFIATVSHELRTPLTPIRGWATTLLQRGDDISPEQRHAALDCIARQAEGLERLITDLLDVARIEHGGQDRLIQPVDTTGIAQKLADQFRLANPDRAIHVDIPTEMCIARGDDLFVERIVSNLLSNAIKYAPSTLPIGLRVARMNGTVSIAVTDHGPGIPPGECERIFERFARLGDHMTRTTGGAGLGLYIARQLASSMDAALGVESEPGVRTTFTLRMQAAKELNAVA